MKNVFTEEKLKNSASFSLEKNVFSNKYFYVKFFFIFWKIKFLQVDHKDTLSLIKERQMEMNVYSQ